MKTGIGISLALIGLGLSACAMGGDRGGFVSEQRTAARQFEEQGRLAESLVRWRFVAAVQPGGEASSEIHRLNGVIASRRDEFNQKGKSALAKGQTRQAKIYFLKALSYDGDDAEARRQLRDIDLQDLWRHQKAKDQDGGKPGEMGD